MQLVGRPTSFEDILTGNLFGDLLSDAASVLTGSIGLPASAMLGEGVKGMFEAGHGTALHIAGRDVANPMACIRRRALAAPRRAPARPVCGGRGCDTLSAGPGLPYRAHPLQQYPAGWNDAPGRPHRRPCTKRGPGPPSLNTGSHDHLVPLRERAFVSSLVDARGDRGCIRAEDDAVPASRTGPALPGDQSPGHRAGPVRRRGFHDGVVGHLPVPGGALFPRQSRCGCRRAGLRRLPELPAFRGGDPDVPADAGAALPALRNGRAAPGRTTTASGSSRGCGHWSLSCRNRRSFVRTVSPPPMFRSGTRCCWRSISASTRSSRRRFTRTGSACRRGLRTRAR
jgi:hypothetical protein